MDATKRRRLDEPQVGELEQRKSFFISPMGKRRSLRCVWHWARELLHDEGKGCITQTEWPRRVGSSQSRVAKMEAC